MNVINRALESNSATVRHKSRDRAAVVGETFVYAVGTRGVRGIRRDAVRC